MQIQQSVRGERPRSTMAKTQLMDAQMHGWRSPLFLLVLLLVFRRIAEAGGSVCKANSAALEALHSTLNFTVQTMEPIGYGFYFRNPALSQLVGGPNVTRGLVILPADGIDAAAYAPYARAVALYGYYVVIVKEATPGTVVEAMMQHPELVYWSLVGHGTAAGELAARMAVTFHPKVKSLVLIASVLPPGLDLKSVNMNLFLTVIYGDSDTVTTPADVTNSFSRVMGDTKAIKISGFGHFDFAYSTCSGNTKAPSNETSSIINSSDSFATINMGLMYSTALLQWAAGTEKALSYGDNHYLTPGYNDSKPYPGDIRVRFDELPIPGTLPQRTWWVFTPSRIKGGIVYYPGAAVDGRAYFPLAFEIAARGHLVVVVQFPARIALNTLQDANSVIDSNLPIFSGVPKGRWAISGHSAGASGATYYLACFGNKIYGAVLHSGWACNTSSSEVPALLIDGSIDNTGGGNNSHVRKAEGLCNPNKTTFVIVEGANHYQVGDYGYQVPDQISTMSLEGQHEIFATHTVNFLDSLETKAYAPVISSPVSSAEELTGDHSSTELGVTHTTLWTHKQSGLSNSIEFGAGGSVL
ncbi:unnamed protein product [Calypogeia fissa]